MTTKAAFVLGLFLVLAALVHGGIYAAGHDFVVNRFTGWYEYVPGADDGWEDEAGSRRAELCRTLTSTTPAARFAGLHRRR
jgi:hypothetical protein